MILTGVRKYEDVDCPTCGALVGNHCRNLHNSLYPVLTVHNARKRKSIAL